MKSCKSTLAVDTARTTGDTASPLLSLDQLEPSRPTLPVPSTSSPTVLLRWPVLLVSSIKIWRTKLTSRCLDSGSRSGGWSCHFGGPSRSADRQPRRLEEIFRSSLLVHGRLGGGTLHPIRRLLQGAPCSRGRARSGQAEDPSRRKGRGGIDRRRRRYKGILSVQT